MATKLGLYNAALREIGNRNLTSTTESVEARFVLDDVYDDALADCLMAGQWNFAVRAVKLDSDTGVTPEFGPSEVFAKPSDFVRVVGFSADPDFAITLSDYVTEKQFWVSYTTPVYLRYISNGASYGLDIANWPRSFTRYVELSLAQRICERLTQNASKKEKIDDDVKRALNVARSRDAMDEAQPRYGPMGSWNSARSSGSRDDRGSRSKLTG